MKINCVTLAIYLHTVLGMHMGTGRRSSTVTRVIVCWKGLCKGERWVVIAVYGQRNRGRVSAESCPLSR